MGCNKSKPKNPSLTEDNNGPDDLMVDENSGTGGTIFFAQRVDRRKQSDVSLENILNNPPIYQAFQAYLCQQFAEELLLFWRECNNFSKLVQSERKSKNRDVQGIKQQAQSIFDRYLASNAPNRVDIDSATILDVEDFLKSPEPVPDTIFDMSQDKIFQKLKFDYMPKFLASPQFHDLYKELGTQEIPAPIPMPVMTEEPEEELAPLNEEGEESFESKAHALSTGEDYLSPRDTLGFSPFEREVLKNTVCAEYFRSFLNAHCASDLLSFYTEVNDFRSSRDETYRRRRAQRINQRYILSEKGLSIQIPEDIKESIATVMKNSKTIGQADTFDMLSAYVVEHLETCYLADFRQSAFYRKYQQMANPAQEQVHRQSLDALRQFEEERNVSTTQAIMREQLEITTLSDVFSRPKALHFFKRHMQREFCEENLLFYLDVQDLKGELDVSVPDKVSQAQQIVDKYLKSESQFEINVDDTTKQETIEKVAGFATRDPAELTVDEIGEAFNMASIAVYQTMQRDTLRRFLASENYETYMQTAMNKFAHKFYGRTTQS